MYRPYGLKLIFLNVFMKLRNRYFPSLGITLELDRWYGRLGNNIQQICVGIAFARRLGAEFRSPHHPMINPIRARFGVGGFTIWGRFFFFDSSSAKKVDVTLNSSEVVNAVNKIGVEFVYPALKIFVQPALPSETLVIHLRGGDVYEIEASIGDYTQNPVDYFVSLIQRFEKTVVVHEKLSGNRPHPLLEGIFRDLDNSCVCLVTQSSIVENDFGVLLAAQHLASSGVGTFAVAAALLSPNLKKFYCTDLYLRSHLNPEMLPSEKVEMTHLTGYIPIGAWDTSYRTLRIQQQFKVN